VGGRQNSSDCDSGGAGRGVAPEEAHNKNWTHMAAPSVFANPNQAQPDARFLHTEAQQMSHDADSTPIEPNATPVTRSAAQRMRAHRERRRLGLRVVAVQVFESELDALVNKGLLAPETRNDARAIIQALHRHFEQTLAPAP
jgi:hypothetical protein